MGACPASAAECVSPVLAAGDGAMGTRGDGTNLLSAELQHECVAVLKYSRKKNKIGDVPEIGGSFDEHSEEGKKFLEDHGLFGPGVRSSPRPGVGGAEWRVPLRSKGGSNDGR